MIEFRQFYCHILLCAILVFALLLCFLNGFGFTRFIRAEEDYDNTITVSNLNDFSDVVSNYNEKNETAYTFKLEQNLELNSADFTKNSYFIRSFYEILDGNGHSITINYDTANGNAGLFLKLYGTVKNLKIIVNIDGSNLGSPNSISGVASSVYEGAVIQNCYIEFNITNPPSSINLYGITAAASSDKNFNHLYLKNFSTNTVYAYGLAEGATSKNEIVGKLDNVSSKDGTASFVEPSSIEEYQDYWIKNEEEYVLKIMQGTYGDAETEQDKEQDKGSAEQPAVKTVLTPELVKNEFEYSNSRPSWWKLGIAVAIRQR